MTTSGHDDGHECSQCAVDPSYSMRPRVYYAVKGLRLLSDGLWNIVRAVEKSADRLTSASNDLCEKERMRDA